MAENPGAFAMVRGQATARFVLRGPLEAAGAASAAFGVALPEQINRASASGARAALMLGPDEWLLLADDALAGALEPALQAALAAHPSSLVDVSHRQSGLLLEGRAVMQVLNAAMPLDLAPEAFPTGMATRTLFDKSDIVLWRTGTDSFRLEVWRSFTPYVEALLQVFAKEAGR